MVEEFDSRLKDWVGRAIQGVELSLAAPDAVKTGRGVGLYLLELIQSPPPSTSRRPPLQLTVRYLITAWSDKPEDAHQILVELMLPRWITRIFKWNWNRFR